MYAVRNANNAQSGKQGVTPAGRRPYARAGMALWKWPEQFC